MIAARERRHRQFAPVPERGAAAGARFPAVLAVVAGDTGGVQQRAVLASPGQRRAQEGAAAQVQRLGRHEMPRAVEFREALPRSPAGKLLAKVLIAEQAEQTGTNAAPAPATPSNV